VRRERIDIALLYPSPRNVAYSSIAFHLLRGYLEESGVRHAAYFLEDGKLIAERPSPPPSEARIILVSLPYELLYIDLVRALDEAGIPVWAKDRREGPVIVAGGPAVTANPLPLYGIVDAFLIGEAEPVLEAIIEASFQGDVKESLADAGLLVPGLRDRVRRIYVKNLDEAWYPIVQRVPRDVEPVWGRSFMLETTRGCGRMCRFCMEGTIFRPKRDRSFHTLKHMLEEGVEVNKVGKVSFYSLAFFDSPHAQRILEHAVSLGLEVSVPSLRAETITEERARLIAEGGQKSITIAPETGSCRLGAAINKCIGREGALAAVEEAIRGGIRKVKLYIIVGFPHENQDDIRETVDMIREASKITARNGGSLSVSINPFIPKPVTAMQWAGLEDLAVLRSKIAYVSKESRKAGARASTYDPRWAVAQTILSRGGPEVAKLIVEWARSGGGLGGLRRAQRLAGIRVEEYLAEKPPEWDPPWHEVVEHPYARLEHLRREYQLYLRLASREEPFKVS